ncbi:helix-turn-helix transcriptional regulator [Amorphus sp. 3PC139-8]|uniref:helix-turn-helix transcriptional regulator n=1 Tax=Amorphus sp. 3PC139-8 TaxID=2735676 RepID=UPI00345D4A2A
MKSFSFTIVASGLNPEAEDFEDRFFAAGCDDATISLVRSRILLDFDREAKNLIQAVVSAVRDVERAGARVERIEPDPLVSISDIAERSGLTRQAVSLYARGERGAGFPAPVARVSSDAPLWDWAEVASWFCRRGKLSAQTAVAARVVAWANDGRRAPTVNCVLEVVG